MGNRGITARAAARCAYRLMQTAGRGSIVKRLTVALVFGLFTPPVFAQTVKQKEMVFPSCVEIISGTERHLQCESVITRTAEPTGEKSLPGRKGGKAQAKRLTPEQRKDATKASKAAAKARPVYFLETLPGRQIRDFEDSPDGPIISVAR